MRNSRHAWLLIGLWLCARSAGAAEPWTMVKQSGTIKIYNRAHPGSDIKELKAVGIIHAPAYACKNVVDDEGHFKDFMPYTDESKILKVDRDAKYTYQRIDAPFISDRDYTLRIQDRSYRKSDGTVVYKKVWKQANHVGPKKKSGVVRLEVNQGFWQFEPLGPRKTRVTYFLHTDPGGALPSFLVNRANNATVPDLFAVVEKQAQKPRYQKKRPPVPAASGASAAAQSSSSVDSADVNRDSTTKE